MCPVLCQIPGPPAWAAVLLCLILGGAGLLLELYEQRRVGTWPNLPRLVLMPLIGVALGAGISLGLQRWGPVSVRAWGTMLMFGFIGGMAWALWDSRNDDEIDADTLIDVTLAILIGAVIGSRLLAVALNWGDFAASPIDVFKVWEGGLSFHGGLLGGIAGCGLYVWRRGLSFPRVADLLTPSMRSATHSRASAASSTAAATARRATCRGPSLSPTSREPAAMPSRGTPRSSTRPSGAS